MFRSIFQMCCNNMYMQINLIPKIDWHRARDFAFDFQRLRTRSRISFRFCLDTNVHM